MLKLTRMVWQANMALTQLQRMMDIAQVGMMSNPAGFALAAVSFGGRIAGSLAYSNRMNGSGMGV